MPRLRGGYVPRQQILRGLSREILLTFSEWARIAVVIKRWKYGQLIQFGLVEILMDSTEVWVVVSPEARVAMGGRETKLYS
jgi:hypothetical protein